VHYLSKIAVGLSALFILGVANAEDAKTFKVWWFEQPGNAQDAAWTKAIDAFKTKHPGVNVSFELKTFDQLQKAGSLILNSNQAPDVLEYNKGNATAGLVASQGLLTPLDDEFKKRGWNKILDDNDTQLSKYDQRGVFGSGPIIGVPANGEFVSAFYNEDLFESNGLRPPTNLAEFNNALEVFAKMGITPLALGTVESNGIHLLYTLALTQADDTWIKNYQGLKAPLDVKPFVYAAQIIQDWVKKGYISKDATGLKDDDAVGLFMSGKAPIFISGTWYNGSFFSKIKNFKWSKFIFPTQKLTEASTGSLFVVPTSAKNKELAYDFIDEVLSKKSQNDIADGGGVAVNADLSKVSNPVGKRDGELFKEIREKGGFGFYPDWPVPGFYELLCQSTTGIVAGSLTPEQLGKRLKAAYDETQSSQ
jgi:raffinose/stachyose/melibiose transport system substrate-binding protein